ncbi:MAG: permease prefix domain 1-containing protein [Oscillospiraceae bacterium]|nr:permease prefix domain 1-containing protein [Oscillospiraceae bacterium]
MNERILAHVDALFRDAPRKRSVSEIREELLGNMNEKYADLLAQGRAPDDAFAEVVAGIGDIQSLIAEVGKGGLPGSSDVRQKALLFSAAGGGLMLAGALVMFLLLALNAGTLATILSTALMALGVASLVYGSGLKRPEPYQKEDDSFVEEYKEKYSRPGRNTRLRGAATSLLWILIVLMYFLISFITGGWASTWVLFLVGVVLQQVVNSIFSDTNRTMTTGMVMTTAVIVYLIISFGTGRWDITWLIFLGAVAVDQAVRFLRIWREKE